MKRNRTIINGVSRLLLLSLGLFFIMFASSRLWARESKADKEKAAKSLRQFLGFLYQVEVAQGQEGSLRGQGEARGRLPEREKGFAQARLAAATALFETLAPRLAQEQATALRQQLKGLSEALASQGLKDASLAQGMASLRQNLWQAFGVDGAPALAPERAEAARLYGEHCQSCHGVSGRGDGVLAAKLPQPVPDFGNRALMASYAPLMILNVLLEGVDESPMPSFAQQFSARQLWSLSYYVLSLAWSSEPQRDEASSAPLSEQEKKSLLDKGLSLALLAQNNDEQLQSWLAAGGLCEGEACQRMLKYLRGHLSFEVKLPRTAPAS